MCVLETRKAGTLIFRRHLSFVSLSALNDNAIMQGQIDVLELSRKSLEAKERVYYAIWKSENELRLIFYVGKSLHST